MGGYNIGNKLPYTVNWTFDLQYQLSNSWLFSAGYVGNHGVHEILPIPFNQPGLQPAKPINGQIYSYGGVSPLSGCNDGYWISSRYVRAEYSGNAPVSRAYIGYDMNSVLYTADGISNYNALQLQAANGYPVACSYRFLHLVALARRTSGWVCLYRQQYRSTRGRTTPRRISIRRTFF